MKKTIERLGETRRNKESLGGYEMKIVEYGDISIIVEFQDEHKAKVKTQYGHFLEGVVKNPYHPSVFGVGFMGEGKYKARVNGKITKAYSTWCNMIKRCYDAYYLNKYPTYIDCYVCEEWLCFQNFGKWFEENYYEIEGEKMHLDKDILCKGNKIYSPNTCTFTSERINLLFVRNDAKRGDYPIGVTLKKDNILESKCNILDENNKPKYVHLGSFPLNEPFHAFYVYKQFKENYIKKVADEYYSKGLIPQQLYESMCNWRVEIND